jgi:hypothetical protein
MNIDSSRDANLNAQPLPETCMPNEAHAKAPEAALPSSLPADDLARLLVLAQSDSPDALHIGLVGDTYTILLGGKDTAGKFCLIDMHVPPGAARRRIATTSRKLSWCWKARSKRRFAA